MKIQFEHRQSAHCENGVTAGLFSYNGIEMTEPLVFGLGSGLFFAHMPFMKLSGIPVTGFRPLPGIIFTRAAKRLGIKMKIKTYRDEAKAMADLDANLEQGIPTGCVVGVFHLTYFPAPYRFHFNAHNLVVFGKEEDRYLISDPVMETINSLTHHELKKVRFAKGTAPPKGKMYWPVHVPKQINLEKALVKGIRKTCYDMTEIPLPFFGAKGIKYLAGQVRKWPKKLGAKKANLYLGQVVRMQEEIGTGGAGFRFLYAAFLQQCSKIFGDERFKTYSLRMTEIGDLWREFAVEASRVVKNRSHGAHDFESVAAMLDNLSALEQQLFTDLYKTAKELDKKY
ncbi:MAG: BtrH N-terminal domain-containing protein [Flavobacteriales bacterium]|nr:BtrH N-terminal domain-containing protein [Flavobacteriales bacterium]